MSKKVFQGLTLLALSFILQGTAGMAIRCSSAYDYCTKACPTGSCAGGPTSRNAACSYFGRTEDEKTDPKNAKGALMCKKAWSDDYEPALVCAIGCIAMKEAQACTGDCGI